MDIRSPDCRTDQSPIEVTSGLAGPVAPVAAAGQGIGRAMPDRMQAAGAGHLGCTPNPAHMAFADCRLSGRPEQPEQIAGTCAFVAPDAGGFGAGRTITTDGGITI